MSFSENLFWDADPSLLDYDANRKYVIERVVTRGTLDDVRKAFAYYGKDVIIDTVTRLRSLDPRALSFIACITSTPLASFRCYTERQSEKAPWIY